MNVDDNPLNGMPGRFYRWRKDGRLGSSVYTISYQGKDATPHTLRWRYTRWEEETGRNYEYLYNHQSVPEEYINLADVPEYKSALSEMQHKFGIARNKVRSTLNK